ncbi:MAG: hypothetical protein IIX44_08065 [Clostridia bacterium]|nr:hypothetical protein [Clostridia bacterium]
MNLINKIKQRVTYKIEMIQANPRRAMITAFFFFLVLLIFWAIAGIYVALITIAFFFTYSSAMDIGKKAKRKYNELVPTGTLTERQTMRLSVENAMLIYWYWGLVSLIPITNYTAWFIVGLPVTILSSIPLKELARQNKRTWLYWLLQLAIYVVLFLIGQALTFLLA